MCEQNESWDDYELKNEHFNFCDEKEINSVKDVLKIFWVDEYPPSKSDRYLVTIELNGNIVIDITEYFKREDKPELSRWSDHINGNVVRWAELPELKS